MTAEQAATQNALCVHAAERICSQVAQTPSMCDLSDQISQPYLKLNTC